jgi:hypothetical protein
MALDSGAMRRGATAAPSDGAGAAARALLATSEGQAIALQLEQERAMRRSAEGLLPVADAAQGLMASHPILGTLGLGVASNLAGQGAAGLMGQLAQALGMGGQAVQAGATAGGKALEAAGATAGASLQLGALGRLGLVGSALVAGYEAGTALDEHYGTSDYISGTGRHSRVAEDAGKDFADAEYLRKNPEADYFYSHPEANAKAHAKAVARVKAKYSAYVSEDPTQDYGRGISIDPNEIYNAVKTGIRDSASALQSVVKVQSADGSPVVAVDQAKASQPVGN